MILKESEIDQDTIISYLGKPYKEPGKWFTVKGSTYFFIKELRTVNGEEVLIWEDSKGIFQRYENGLALYVNRSNYQRVVLMKTDSFTSFSLTINNEGGNKEMVLSFSTDTYIGRFIGNFSSYKSQVKYFTKMGFNLD